MEDMEKKGFQKLEPEALEQVTGGNLVVVNTGTDDKAAVRRDHCKGKNQIAALENGTMVNTISDLVFDPESGRNWVEIEFTDKKGKLRTGWIAASIVGLKR